MKTIYPIHDRARVVFEGDSDPREFGESTGGVLEVQVLNDFDHWDEEGAHCVVEDPEAEAEHLVSEFRSVAGAILPDNLQSALYTLRRVTNLADELADELFQRAGDEASVFLGECAEKARRIRDTARSGQ